MRILVCGGRDFTDKNYLFTTLTRLWWDHTVEVIIHGGARGADSLAGEWAEEWKFPVEVFPADWETHGRSAGPIRNRKMLAEGKPDLVIAFPGGKGTRDMINAAIEAGVEVRVMARFKPGD